MLQSPHLSQTVYGSQQRRVFNEGSAKAGIGALVLKEMGRIWSLRVSDVCVWAARVLAVVGSFAEENGIMAKRHNGTGLSVKTACRVVETLRFHCCRHQ